MQTKITTKHNLNKKFTITNWFINQQHCSVNFSQLKNDGSKYHSSIFLDIKELLKEINTKRNNNHFLLRRLKSKSLNMLILLIPPKTSNNNVKMK